MMTSIKYASRNNSNLLHSSLFPRFTKRFINVKTDANIAKIPIDSEFAKIEETKTANIEISISKSMFCKIKLFLYKYSVLLCVNAKILLSIFISPYFVLVC